MHQSYLHHFLFAFIYQKVLFFFSSQAETFPWDVTQKIPVNRSLPLNNYPLLSSHIHTLLTLLLLSTAALFYLPLSSSLPSADVNIWQLTVGFFFPLIRTLEVLIGHYTLFLGPPAGPPPLLQTLWSSDEIFQGNNRFLCTPIAVLRRQKAHIKNRKCSRANRTFRAVQKINIYRLPLKEKAALNGFACVCVCLAFCTIRKISYESNWSVLLSYIWGGSNWDWSPALTLRNSWVNSRWPSKPTDLREHNKMAITLFILQTRHSMDSKCTTD